MTFKDALHILSINLVQKIIFPDWAKYLTKKARKIDLAFMELKVCYFAVAECAFVIYIAYFEQQYMVEMVDARRDADKVEERYDLFSGLLDAAQDEQGGGGVLSNEELIGEYIRPR